MARDISCSSEPERRLPGGRYTGFQPAYDVAMSDDGKSQLDDPDDEAFRSQSSDADMQAVPRAQRAREIAQQTGTPLVIRRDGVLVEEWVTDDEQSNRAGWKPA